ncbi:MAG: CCA tRNA nucleotidyltransferase [Alphaproteobacteria bacterium]|nr:CCA tRNA nucleotidyltransferase [Alphaproteobacteria bacterium]
MRTNQVTKELVYFHKLRREGFEVYAVGGYPRDTLLGREPADMDICTNATPEEIMELFKDNSPKLAGKTFPVVIIQGVEIATFRKDLYLEDGTTKWEYAKTFEEDAARRDFTWNAIGMKFDRNNNVQVIDPFNGQQDIKDKKLRFVGNGDDRIKEDPIRLFRAARLVSMVDGASLDKEAFCAIMRNNRLVHQIPRERIYKEFMKVLSTYDKPSLFIDALSYTRLLRPILPELHDAVIYNGGKYHKEDIQTHMLSCVDNLPKEDPILRFAGLIHDIGKVEAPGRFKGSFINHDKIGARIAEKRCTDLCFSKKDMTKVVGLIRLHMRQPDLTVMKPKHIRKTIQKCNEYDIDWKDLVQLMIADQKANKANIPWEQNTIDHIHTQFKKQMRHAPITIKDLEVDGHDLMKLGLRGEDITKTFQVLTGMVIGDPGSNKRHSLISCAKAYHKHVLNERGRG